MFDPNREVERNGEGGQIGGEVGHRLPHPQPKTFEGGKAKKTTTIVVKGKSLRPTPSLLPRNTSQKGDWGEGLSKGVKLKSLSPCHPMSSPMLR